MSGTSDTTADSNGRVSVAAARSTAGHWFGSDGRGTAFAINIGSSPLQRRGAVAATNSAPRL